MDPLDNEIKIEPNEVIWYYIQRDDDYQPMIFLRKMVRHKRISLEICKYFSEIQDSFSTHFYLK